MRAAEQSRRCAGTLSNPTPPSRTVRPLNAARAQDPIYQPGVALFIAELKQAYPELFHAFYIGNLVGKGGWLVGKGYCAEFGQPSPAQGRLGKRL